MSIISIPARFIVQVCAKNAATFRGRDKIPLPSSGEHNAGESDSLSARRQSNGGRGRGKLLDSLIMPVVIAQTQLLPQPRVIFKAKDGANEAWNKWERRRRELNEQ